MVVVDFLDHFSLLLDREARGELSTLTLERIRDESVAELKC